MKFMVVVLCLSLAACSRAPEAPTEAPAAAPVTAIDSWAGKYEGDVMVRIDAAHKVVLVEAQADGCTGDVGMSDGGVPARTVGAGALEIALQPEGIGLCTIRLNKAGDKVTVSESPTCAAYHGATCSFNGTAVRIKP